MSLPASALTDRARRVYDAMLELDRRWMVLQEIAIRWKEAGRSEEELIAAVDAAADTPERKQAQQNLEHRLANFQNLGALAAQAPRENGHD